MQLLEKEGVLQHHVQTLERKNKLSLRLSCPLPFHPMPVPCSSHNGQGRAFSMAEMSRKRRDRPSSPHRPLLPLCPSRYENQSCKHARTSPGGTHWAILLTLVSSRNSPRPLLSFTEIVSTFMENHAFPFSSFCSPSCSSPENTPPRSCCFLSWPWHCHAFKY